MSQKSKTRRIIAIILGLAILALLVFASRALFELKPVVEPTLATIESDSGNRLVIHRIESFSHMEIDGALRPIDKILATNSSFTYALGGHGSVIQIQAVNGRIELGRFQYPNAAFILLATIEDNNGNPVSSNYFTSWGSQDLYEIIRDDSGVFDGMRDTTTAPPWTLEVSKGDGTWIPTAGPFIPNERDGRGFYLTPVFPRSIPKLTLRFNFGDDSEPKTIEVPNPGYSPPSPNWTADPQPWIKELGEIALSVEEIKRHRSPSGQFYTSLDVKLHPRIDQPADAWHYQLSTVSDRFGNQCGNADFDLMPGVEFVRYTYVVRREPSFSWPAAETVELGELVWPKSGSSPVAATLTAAAERMDIRTLTLAEDGHSRRFDSKQWSVNIQAEGKDRSRGPEFGDHFTIILGNGTHSTGAINTGSGGSSYSSTASSYKIELDTSWCGEIPDGERVWIVKTIPRNPMEASFTLHVDDLVASPNP